MDDHVEIYRKREPASLPNAVVREFNEDSTSLLAHYVLDGRGVFSDILRIAESGRFTGNGIDWRKIEPSRLAMATRVLALTAETAGEFERAQRMYDLLARKYGMKRIPDFHQGIHAQVAFRNRDIRRLRELMSGYRRIPAPVRATMELNLAHPSVDLGNDWGGWLTRLETLMPPARFSFAADDDLGQTPFDRLRAEPYDRVQDAATVTVVVTCHEPDEQLTTSVRSICAQSWRNLDILIIDDGSSEESDAVLKACEAMDDRVRVVRLAGNRGTYGARNRGIDLAEGEFLTFQDADDWSHPNRIEHLLAKLRADESAKIVVADGIKIESDLTVDRVGRPWSTSACPPRCSASPNCVNDSATSTASASRPTGST
ncbi:hypothetical protein GCM10029992_05830 [Glycomyces albus]